MTTKLMDLDDSALITRIQTRFAAAETYSRDWRTEAKELYALVSGDQWSEEDKLKMMEQLRPAVTFNITGKYIDAVSGLQVTNRQELKYLPREEGDSGVNELLTGTADWVRDECDAEDEESEAFYDMLISGEGDIEMAISFDENPAGDIVNERRDPLEMYWDPRARKRNRRDARWGMRVSRMTEEDIVDRWGQEKYDDMAGTMGIEPESDDTEIHHATEAWKYEGEADDMWNDSTIPVIHYQQWERVDAVHVKTQYGEKTFTSAQWRKMREVLEKNGIDYEAQRTRKRTYYQVFAAGGIILDKKESPYQEGFTWRNLTGKRDRNRNTFYGIARGLKDPQQWTNKMFSTIIYSMASGAKGGLMAEEGAFTDPARAEDSWSSPDSITWLEDGALSEGKVQEKTPATYPAGLDRLMQFALTSAPEVSGINLEILGMANRVQPGVVEAQRKQSAMTMIAWAFDSMRRYYKDHGRMLAYYIREYISDGRLARVATKTGQKYIPLVKDEMTMEFDVIVDEAPTSTNVKERVWAVLEALLPQLMKMGMPVPPEILDFSPLPSDLAQKWKELLQPDPQAQQAQQKAQQLEMAAEEAEVKETESKAELNQAKKVEVLANVRKKAAETGKIAAGG